MMRQARTGVFLFFSVPHSSRLAATISRMLPGMSAPCNASNARMLVTKPIPPKISPAMAMILHPVSRLHPQQHEETRMLELEVSSWLYQRTFLNERLRATRFIRGPGAESEFFSAGDANFPSAL